MSIPADAPVNASFSAEVAGHHITVIPYGPDRLARIVSMIGGAKVSLKLLYYTFESDECGTAIRDALVGAQQRGVTVSMLLDSFGSGTTADAFFDPLRAAGGTVRWFGTRWTPDYLIRNHQKLLIADDAAVLSGGFNIGDPYFGDGSNLHDWRDLGVHVIGPQVATMVEMFAMLAHWMDAPRPRFRDLRRIVKRWQGGDASRGPVRWLIGGPTPRLSPWTRTLRQDMAQAQQMTLTTAYFSPNAGMARRIGRIAKRGTVTVVLPSHSDNPATVGAARLLYGFLMKRGVTIFEYEPTRLHNKLVILDDIVFIGSSNFDMRSLYVNMELMLRVEDAEFAAQCRALVAAQTGYATQMTPALHKARAGWFTKARWALSWLVVNVIDYSVTRRLNFGLADPK
jgi:cardiolipin synthase